MTVESPVFRTGARRTAGARRKRARYTTLSRQVMPRQEINRNPRRKFAMAVPDVAGAEMQLPAVPILRQGRRALALVLMVAVFLTGFYLLTNPRFEVGMPEVYGGQMLTNVQVSSIAGVRGKPVFLVDVKAVEERLESYAEIKTAEITLGWPNLVQIQIQERLPVLSWADGSREWWISSDGVAFLGRENGEGLIKVKSQEAVLNIEEDPLEPVINREIIVAVQVLRIEIPEIQEYTYDREHGLGFADSRGWQVYFGKNGDMSMKVRIYQQLVERFEEEKIIPELVSLEHSTSPYYR